MAEDKAAEQARKQKESEATLKRLVQEIDDDPDNYHTYYDLASLLVVLKSYSQAEELLMKALGLFADRSKKAKDTLTYGLGNVYYEAGEYKKAIVQFSDISDSQLQSDAYLMIAQSYMGQGNHKQALVFALTAQAKRQQDPEVNRLIGQNLLALGNFAEAKTYFDQVLASDATDGASYFDRGLTEMVLGDDYDDDFAKAKGLDLDYFNKGQKRLEEIEAFIKERRQE